MRRIDPESSEGKAKMRAMDRMLEMLSYTNTKPREKKEPTSPPEDGSDPDEEAIELQETESQDDDVSNHEPDDMMDDGPVESAAEAERHDQDREPKTHKTLDLRKLRQKHSVE